LTHAACDDTEWTWKEYYNDTIKAAKSFMHLGLGRFESVSILGFNSPEWLLSNMGAIAAGGFAAGIYTTNEPDACKYILKHSKARIVVVDGQKQLDKILKIRGDLKDLTAIVVWGDKVSPNVNDGVGDGQAPSPTPRSRRAWLTRSPATAPPSSTPPAPPATPRRL
jgi:long-chain-fatty-acid--CoA ligase ACSBG